MSVKRKVYVKPVDSISHCLRMLMNNLNHFILMAEYNHRMNNQIINVISDLSDEKLNQDLGAYFSSILGTLNHILVGDIIWLSRFCSHSAEYVTLRKILDLPKPSGLNDVLCSDLVSFKLLRNNVDTLISDWLKNEVNVNDFLKNVKYSNTKGVVSVRNFGELLSHLFNHQTHHRGQLSTLLYQQGIDVGVTDFLLEIPEASV
ncbi:DinB family protein [Vibrio sp. WJH972]